jgi:hypothetical protein
MNLPIITSTEYKYNQPSVFTIIDTQYFGCLIYPQIRNYPPLEYWQSATGSDSDRYFNITEKEFSEAEIDTIKNLQSAINSLKKLVPNQPKTTLNIQEWKVKRGAKYQAWLKIQNENAAILSEWHDRTKYYDLAITQASRELRNILTK